MKNAVSNAARKRTGFKIPPGNFPQTTATQRSILGKTCSSTINVLSLDVYVVDMPEAVGKDDTVEELDNLPDEDIEERAGRALERFKNKVKKYSSE